MKLFTKKILTKLTAAGYDGNAAICKIFNPYGPATWVLFGQDPEHPDRLVCVADLGMDCIEGGTVLRSELEGLRIKVFGQSLPLERDRSFTATGKPMSHFLALPTLAGC